MKIVGHTDNGIPYTQAELEAYDDSFDESDTEPVVRSVWGRPLFWSLLVIAAIAVFGWLMHGRVPR